jgi:sulfite exporter TauE/SafE
MNSALAATALLMGLAGAPHCAAMCGAACAGVARACGGASQASNLAALHVARLLAYATGGAIVAAGVSWLSSGAQEGLRPLWSLVHAAALGLGVWLLWHGRQPIWLERLGRRPAAEPGRVVWLRGPARAAAVGSAWVVMPCGLLQSALVVAALGNGPLDGALLMGLFAAASALGLWFGPAVWQRLQGAGASASQWGTRVAGLLLAGASLWALWHGVAPAPDICLR